MKDTYKSFEDFKKELIKTNYSPDFVSVGGFVYTMDNYDEEGKELSFGNKKNEKGFLIKTKDRYNEGFKDAIIEEFEPCCFRNDIQYFE